ncbi:MAG: DUF4202 domain-containing protein [Candidatus Competibacteraceae bacterium]|nr:DUF4202 domain-containing protein [Candidatus Competibacteraceae bacterium]
MSTDPNRFNNAIARFDQANAEDPNKTVVGDTEYPKELLYAQRMAAQLEQFAPAASEALRLAARCQHIRRWTIPRDQYPAGRKGYKQWRANLAKFHADTASEILREVGYDDTTIRQVQALLRKEKLKSDPEVQTLEDVICLVFLNHYFADFAHKHDEEKIIDILRKTWKKMSPEGQAAALALELAPDSKNLVGKALTADSPG